MTTQPTPGPWKVHRDFFITTTAVRDGYEQDAGNGWEAAIAFVYGPKEQEVSLEQARADARLIAAAPRMLEALRELMAVVEVWNKDVRELDVERLWEAMREARALLRDIHGDPS